MTRPTPYRNHCHPLDISHFNQIVAINRDQEYVLAEPGVTMERLVAATLPHQLIPRVVPEFRGITVGGALVGGALESSSHRYGQFSDACLWCEVLLGSGERLVISASEHADLFFALSGSYGTLAIVTLVAIALIPCEQSVRLHYETHSSLPHLDQSNFPFLECLLLRPQCYVTIEGEFSSQIPTLNLHRRSAPWFYQHVYTHRSKNDFLSVTDYLFRFDRGAFWMGQFLLHPALLAAYCFSISSIANCCAKLMKRGPCPRFPSKIFRTIFSPWLSSQALYAGWHAMPHYLQREVLMIQDVAIPLSKALPFLEHATSEYRIFPLWLCPVRHSLSPQPFSPYWLPDCTESHLLNIGIYGVPLMGGQEASLDLEKEACVRGGRLGLYSQCYLDHRGLWERYDYSLYQRLRKTYRAERVFCDLETKLLHI